MKINLRNNYSIIFLDEIFQLIFLNFLLINKVNNIYIFHLMIVIIKFKIH